MDLSVDWGVGDEEKKLDPAGNHVNGGAG